MNNKQTMQPCTEEYKTSFGWIYKIPKQSCLLCNNCEHVLYDSNGPYLFTCYKAIDENGIIDVFKMGVPFGNCDEFENRR